MPNTVPYEVIAAPFTLYVAAVGTEFPDVDEVPGVAWTKVGTSGPLNYDSDEGVTVEHQQTLKRWRSLGEAGSRKIFRDEESLLVRLKLMDITLEQYAAALNYNAVTDTPPGSGTAGFRKLGLSRGFTVATKALLVRGNISPYGEDAAWNMQYQVWRAAQVGSVPVQFRKSDPAGLALEWEALIDPDKAAINATEAFGVLVAQDATAF